MSSTAEVQKVRDLMEDSGRIVMLTSVDHAAGRLVSRPMAVQEIDDDGTVWFFASDASPKADELTKDPTVNIAFSSRSSWVSLAGSASIVHDRQKIVELWSPGAESWFPDVPDSPYVGRLRIDPDSAEYWDTPGGRVSAVLAYGKSKITGERPNIGESNVVEL
ncbi:MAG: pyridoxamine 5'-phosphate oxidase family protein [Solirubrobacteraceae bacterium]|nr:pyridoxamine 5'-phosphate oxidase family protein [Solirubrobacteraceae bacterium]